MPQHFLNAQGRKFIGCIQLYNANQFSPFQRCSIIFLHFRMSVLPGVHPSFPPLHLRLGRRRCWLGCWCCWLRRRCCWLGHWRWHGRWTGGYLSQKAGMHGTSWKLKIIISKRKRPFYRFQVSRKLSNLPGLCFDINIPNGFQAVQNGRMFNELLFKCCKIVHIQRCRVRNKQFLRNGPIGIYLCGEESQ